MSENKNPEDLVQEFLEELKKTKKEIGPQIKQLVREAQLKMEEAERLSEIHGLPFEVELYYGTYVPKVFVNVSREFDEMGVDIGEFADEVYNIIDANPCEPYEGAIERGWWQPSRFC